MPRYEFVEGSSSKFWEIELDGTSFTTTYGRIGTDGQSSLKEWPSTDKARQEYDKLIAEKVKKGYLLVDGAARDGAATGGGDTSEEASAKPAAPPAKKSSKAVFEDEGDEQEEAAAPAPAKKPAKPAAAAAAAVPKPAAQSGSSKSGDAGARYFELVDGSSSKFWEIQLDGTSFTTRYGKIGTDGQTSMKEWPSAAKAQQEHDKLVAEKTKKGYVEK